MVIKMNDIHAAPLSAEESHQCNILVSMMRNEPVKLLFNGEWIKARPEGVNLTVKYKKVES